MKEGKISDQELIAWLFDVKTEKQAILFLYDSYYEPLSIFILQNGGTLHDAQDIFQEVVVSFLHLVKQNKFRQDASVKTFLFAINRNLWFNELKRKDRQEKREHKYESLNVEQPKGFESIIENRESSRELLEIFGSLGESCKKILQLFYYENYSIADLLKVLGYENEQVVRNKKYKCLKKLEEMIKAKKDSYNKLKSLLNG